MHWNRTFFSALAGAGLVATLAGISSGQPGGPALTPPGAADSALPDAPPDDKDDNLPEGAEVYTRGPLHEAFAAPVTNDPSESPVVPKQPPEAIDEIPPDQKPEGNNVVWIPGYWAWDEELENFLWISGLWRDAPPGRRWVPGYWNDAEGGFRWVSGAWVSNETEQLTYLPQPPASLENGPSSPAPSEDQIWVPGNWEYGTSYNWRPGYWTPYQEDWIWVPAHYVATPGGFLFVPGYWDYQFVDRGVAFAPVYFRQPVVVPYQPVVVVNTWSNFFVNLFVSPRNHCYVYGNYYNPVYAQAGVVPWYSFHGGRRGYDPIYAHYHHRHGDVFTSRLRGWHDHYRDHANDRPPITLAKQREFIRSRPNDPLARQAALGTSLRRMTRDNDQPFKFAQLSKDQRSAAHEHARDIRSVSRDRVKVERDPIPAAGVGPGRGRPDGNDARSAKTFKLPNDPKFQRPANVARGRDDGPNTRPGANLPGRDDDKPGIGGNRPGRGNEIGKTPDIDPHPGRGGDGKGGASGSPGRGRNPFAREGGKDVDPPGSGNPAANIPPRGTRPGGSPTSNSDNEKTTNTPRPGFPRPGVNPPTGNNPDKPTFRGQNPDKPKPPSTPGINPGAGGTRPGGLPGTNPGAGSGTRPGSGNPGAGNPGSGLRPGAGNPGAGSPGVGNQPGSVPRSNPGAGVNPGAGSGLRPGGGTPGRTNPGAGTFPGSTPRTGNPGVNPGIGGGAGPRPGGGNPGVGGIPGGVPRANPGGNVTPQPKSPQVPPPSGGGRNPASGSGRNPGAGQPRSQNFAPNPGVQPRAFNRPPQVNVPPRTAAPPQVRQPVAPSQPRSPQVRTPQARPQTPAPSPRPSQGGGGSGRGQKKGRG